MPLNVDSPSGAGPSSRPPLMQEPGGGKNRKPILIVAAIAGLAALVFVLFQFGVLDFGSGPEPETAERPPPAMEEPVQSPPPPVVDAPPPRIESPAPVGRYSIIISAFYDRADAEEMAARWARAGFTAFVSSTPSWHRVAIGRFETIGSAREEANRIHEALEYGFWITETGS